MLKVVLDTNVFVSGTILPKGNSFEILQAFRSQEFILLTSPDIIQEIVDVLLLPKFSKKYRVKAEDVKALIYTLCLDSFMTSGKTRIKLIKEDPADNKFISCTLEGEADYIVSGDSHLLALGEYEGIKIISPRRFVEILKEKRQV